MKLDQARHEDLASRPIELLRDVGMLLDEGLELVRIFVVGHQQLMPAAARRLRG